MEQSARFVAEPKSGPIWGHFLIFEALMEDAFFHRERSGERGLDTVSHFFLTDPEARAVLPGSVRPGEGPVKAGGKNNSLDAPSNVSIILCPDGIVSRGSFLGCMLALSLAAADVSVGLIETTTRLPHPFFLSGGYGNLDAVFWEAALDAPDFFNMAARFRKACDFVFVNAAASVLLKTTGVTGWMGRGLVPTTMRSQDLLNAYGTIKNASKRWAMTEIDLVVIKQRSTDKAAEAAVVLEKMVRKFLPCSVHFVGAVTLPDDIGESGSFSLAPSPTALPAAAATAVREIARNLVVSSGIRKKRRAHVEKRL